MKTSLRLAFLLGLTHLILTNVVAAANAKLEGGIAVDGLGNVYVTGSSMGSGSASDYATVKYNSSGAQQWVARYNGPANGEDVAYAITRDSAGNIYVTGSSLGLGTGLDFATIKYNSSGVQQWTKRYNGPANGEDIAYAITVDSAGNVYVTGSSSGGGSGLDYATVKYSSSGTQLWVAALATLMTSVTRSRLTAPAMFM